MKHKLFTLFLAIVACTGTMHAWDYQRVQIDDLYYNLDASNQTAEVTSQNNRYPYWSTTITDANIPASVTYHSVTYNVTSIGSGAFASCSSLTSVTIPNSVTSIGRSAFEFCSSLISVTIPNSVTSIGRGAFNTCSSLTSVTIPNSVTSIGESAFGYVPNIVYSGSADGSPWGARCVNGYIDGFFVYENNTKTHLAACSSTVIGHIVIPNSVTSIGDLAFYNCSSLTSVTIPNSVTSIGRNAFLNCRSLTSVTIPNNVISIGNSAFNGCSSLTSVTIPNSVISIGESVFYSCSSLTSLTIPNSVISIGNSAFNGCSSLTSVTIPNSVISIGNSAFNGCSSLTSVTIPSSVDSIGDFAFSNCGSLSNIEISEGVKCLSNGAFSGCSNLTSIIIPSSVTAIGDYVLARCNNLSSIIVSPANTIYDSRDNCNAVIETATTTLKIGCKNSIVPTSVTHIGDYAFDQLSSISHIEIPEGIVSLGDYAFVDCINLTSVKIPSSVTSIGDWAFGGCYGLTDIKNYSKTPQPIENYVFFGIDKSLCTLQVPDSSINLYKAATGWRDFVHIVAFCDIIVASGECGENGNNVTWELFCDGRLKISGTGAMMDYSSYTSVPWYSDKNSILSIVIDDGITHIGDNAFSYCNNLNSITIPNSVTSIGERAFYQCSNLPVINNLRYADCYLVEAVDKTLYSYTIVEGTRFLGNNAFSNCQKMTSISIPSSVTTIMSGAFNNSGIQSVTIPSSVTNIEIGAFTFCGGLRNINVDADNLFYSSVNGVLFDKTKETLIKYPTNKNGAYYIPNTVTHIENQAFSSTQGLSAINIPNSVICIGAGAFSSCISIQSLLIPESVDTIGQSAFYSCNSLRTVHISSTVKLIGDYAFENCSTLVSVYVKSKEPPTIYATTFSNNLTHPTVYVNFGLTKIYKSAPYWKNMNIQCDGVTTSATAYPSSYIITFEVENTEILSCSIEGGEQQPGNVLEYIGLEPNSEYNNVPIVLTANTGETETVNVSFTTLALELTTKPSKAVSSTTAILLAETNMSDAEVNCGFEYKRNDAPADMDGTKVFCPVASGQMAGRLKNLKDDVYYKYRVFYQSTAGNMYYGDWQYIFTGDVAVEFDPILYTYGATVVQENEATISGYALAGSEDFTEQGFEYWAESRVGGLSNNAPRRIVSAIGEHKYAQASGIKMSVTLTDLDEGTLYKYRAYGKTGNQFFYGSEQTFTTQGEWQEEQGFEEIQSDHVASTKSSKILRDGQIFILRGEKVYTLQGQEVK